MKNSFLTPRGGTGTPLRLEGHVSIGSAEGCQVRVPGAEPHHALLSKTPEGYCIRDLTGRSLVTVNGVATSNVLLRDGDILRIGSGEFVFSETVGEATPRVAVPAAVASPAAPLHPATSRVRKTTKSIPRAHRPPTIRREKSALPLGLTVTALAFLGLVLLGVALSKRPLPRREAVPEEETASAPAPRAVEFPRPAARAPEPVRAPAAPANPVPVVAPGPAVENRAPEMPAPAPVPPAAESPAAAPPAAGPAAAPAAPSPAAAPPGGFLAFLRNPAARSVTAERGPVAESLRASAGNSDVLLFLAYYLSRPEAYWRLTPPMLEVWEAYLKEAPLEKLGALSADEHVSWGKRMLEQGKGHSFSRLVALAHFLEASRENASVEALMTQSGYRKSPDGKYWGDPDAILQYRISRYFHSNEMDDALLEAAAVGSPVFGTRYAGTLVEVRRALARGMGLQAVFGMVTECSAAGGPPKAGEHLRALAASVRAVGYCKDCKAGRVPCTQCQGKGVVDLNCPVCNGEGRVRPRSAVGIDLTMKCRNCDGKKVFKGVTCPTCTGRLSIPCPSCKGHPWKEKTCNATGCKNGRVPCSNCQGLGKERIKCPFCENGRVRAPGAVGDADVTMKCRNCEINGQHGTGYLIRECRTCKGSGRVNCQSCGGMFGKKGEPEAVQVSSVFTTDSCGACGGAGWVHPRMALPCVKCLGLGVLVKPAADASKTLD